MELRKVIKFGRATYSVTLPKKWIVEQGIKKGDVLRIERKSGGKLEVSPKLTEKEVEVKTININANEKSYDDIFRDVVAAYIKNYTIINIEGDIKGKIKDIRSGLQELIGLEIMEVSPQKIVAKSFMDVTETKVEQTLKRIFYMIKSMSSELKSVLENDGSAEELEELDREINRNTFFTMKYLFKALESPELSSKLGMKNYEILFKWELVKHLENIADKVKMMAALVHEQESLKKTSFIKTYEAIEKNFNATMEEYFKKSKKNSSEIFKNIDRNENIMNKILKENKQAWTPLLIDHLRDINMFTKSIAEIIIDLD